MVPTMQDIQRNKSYIVGKFFAAYILRCEEEYWLVNFPTVKDILYEKSYIVGK